VNNVVNFQEYKTRHQVACADNREGAKPTFAPIDVLVRRSVNSNEECVLEFSEPIDRLRFDKEDFVKMLMQVRYLMKWDV
jgi:hypothetical protein